MQKGWLSMKKRQGLLWSVLLLTIVFALGVFQPAGAEPAVVAHQSEAADAGADGVEPVRPEEVPASMRWFSTNGAMSLYVDELNGDFAVWDGRSEILWRSNPDPSTPIDESLSGQAKFRLFSQLLIYTITMDETTSSVLEESLAVSRTGSAVQLGVTVEKTSSGVRICYEFPMEQVMVPLEVSLTNDGVALSVKTAEIEEKGSAHVLWFSLAPYLAAGGPEDEGYLLIPDGSGALIRYGQDKGRYTPYHEAIYGTDPVFVGESRPPITEAIRLPVFGAKINDVSCLGIITKGAGAAFIDAQSGGMYNPWTNAYATFQVYGRDTLTIEKSLEGNARDVIRCDFENRLCEEAQVRYVFSQRGKAEYTDMAQLYRDYLCDEAGWTITENPKSPLYVELFGGFRQKESFLGIKTARYKKATTFEEAADICTQLQNNGVRDIVLLYSGWTADEAAGTLPQKARPASQLGGAAGLRQLAETLKSRNIAFYPSYDPLSTRKGSFGFSSFLDTARKIGSQSIRLYSYSPARLVAQTKLSPVLLPHPDKLGGYADSYADSLKTLPLEGAYYPTLGNLSYTDYTKNRFSNRDSTADTLLKVAQRVAQNRVVKAANEYAIAGAAHISEAPARSSAFHIFDEDVPFYQLVASSFASLSTPCVNRGWDLEEMKLFAIETGSGLYFTWSAAHPELFTGTAYDSLYGANFAMWKERAVQANEQVQEAVRQTGGGALLSHRKLAEDVTLSGFSEGGFVVVNRGNTPYIYEGQSVDAHGWLAIGG